MKLRSVLLSGVCVCSILLCGCSANFSGDSLLHPPKTTGNEAQIQKLIEQTAKGSYMLKYPKSGHYRSAIVTEDINNDKKDEAIAFYRTEGQESATHMLIMYDSGKQWKISCDYSTPHPDVDCVKLADYDYDGIPEILVGFQAQAGGANELAVFDVSEDGRKVTKVDFSTTYSAFTTGDYDQDAGSEILTLSLGSSEAQATATLIDYDKNELYTLSSCSMDGSVTKFESVVSGLLDERTMGVVVDGFSDNAYNTQVLYYNSDKKKLVNFPYTTSKKSNPTTRSYRINSDDIDDNGFVEIPVISDLNSDVSTDEEAVAPIINWCTLNLKSLSLEEGIHCVTNFEYGYYFNLPQNFIGTTVSALSKDNRELKIYGLDGKKKGKLVMTLKVFDVGTSSDEMLSYSTLESYNQYIYTYKIEDNAPIYIDSNTLTKNFALSNFSA